MEESREQSGVSRRNFIKYGTAAIVGASALGAISGCASPSSSNEDSASSANENNVSLASGTYSAVVSSIRGDMTVTTTVNETAITGITIKSADTKHVVGAVVSGMIPRIIENQSVEVDAISGATYSSSALKNGVLECLKEAGADSGSFTTDHKTVAIDSEDESFDAVIVGSGAAGLSAAIQLAYKGARVVVLDKLSFAGGTTGFSSGGVWTSNTVFNENIGYNFTPDSLVKHMYDTTGVATGSLNEALIRKVAEVSGDIYTEYKAEGAPWDVNVFTFGDALEEVPVSWPNMFYTTPYENNAGMTLIDSLVRLAQINGVEIRLNSNVKELLQDSSGGVMGVRVEARDKNYNANAQKVILATGGYQRNAELVEELSPQHKSMVAFTSAGSTGDGIVMARTAGAATVGTGIGGAIGLNQYIGYVGLSGVTTFCTNLRVNKEGKRFYNETDHYSRVFTPICQQTDGIIYGIADSANASVEILESFVDKNYVYKADTLDDLANQAGIPVEDFKATIEAYNSAAASGADDPEFGTPNGFMTPALQAPFYAIITYAVSSFCLSGLKVDENCAIVDEQGNAIPNLFGAGEVISGNLYTETYPGSGSQIGPAIYEGKIIADQIADEIGL